MDSDQYSAFLLIVNLQKESWHNYSKAAGWRTGEKIKTHVAWVLISAC